VGGNNDLTVANRHSVSEQSNRQDDQWEDAQDQVSEEE
jgi:hypothetical protein